MKNENSMSIGILSKETGIGIETIRYYERLSLLKPIGRKTSGYRIFNDDSLKTLRFLKHAQELGFSLSEIKELLKLKADKKSNCRSVQAKAEKHLKDVEEKIERLGRIKFVLSDLVKQCREKRTDEQCPILECFEDCKYSEEQTCKSQKTSSRRTAK